MWDITSLRVDPAFLLPVNTFNACPSIPIHLYQFQNIETLFTQDSHWPYLAETESGGTNHTIVPPLLYFPILTLSPVTACLVVPFLPRQLYPMVQNQGPSNPVILVSPIILYITVTYRFPLPITSLMPCGPQS